MSKIKRKLLSETFYYSVAPVIKWSKASRNEIANAKCGYFVPDDIDGDDKIPIEYKAKRVDFEDLAKDRRIWKYWCEVKGPACLFAFTHRIGDDVFGIKGFPTGLQRALFLGAESWYDTNHYFYVTDIPHNELKDKKVAFTLRVSNHRVNPKTWEDNHSKPKDINCDFCLNLILNEQNRDEPQDSINFKIGVINCNFDYYNYPKDKQLKVDAIISDIVNGKQPTLKYSELVSLFGATPIKISGPSVSFRDENFQNRVNRDFVPPKNSSQTGGVAKQFTISQLIELGAENGKTFKFQGKEYFFDEDNWCCYALRKSRTKKPKEVVLKPNDRKPIPIVDDDSIVTEMVNLNLSDICEMVKNVLKQLL